MTLEQGTVPLTSQDSDLVDALRLSIGGIGFSIQWPEPMKVGWRHPFYKPFVGEANERISLRIHFDDLPDSAGDELLFDGAHHWRLYRHDSRYLFEGFDTITQAKNLVSHVSESFDSAEVYVVPGSSGSPPPWSLLRLLQPLGQWLLMNRLSSLGGVMMHAFGVDDRGRGRLFVGPSGAGKSTLARFWRRRNGIRILGDECVVVRHLGGRFCAYGTPWPGMSFTVSPDPVEIQQIFFIEHDSEHRAWDEPPGSFAALVCSQLLLPFWNHRAMEAVCAVCETLVQEVDCQRLGFARRPDVIDWIRQRDL